VGVLACVTLVVGVPAEGVDFSAWPAGLRVIARGLAVPVLQEPPTELRRGIFFLIVGVCWAASGLAALFWGRRARAENYGLPRGVWVCALVVAVWGAVSAIVNGTGWMSVGWMGQFAVGVAWAAWLAREVDGRGCDRIGTGVAALMIVATGLTLWQQRWSRVTQIDWPIGSVTSAGFVAAVCTAWLGPVVLGDLARGRSSLGVSAGVRMAGVIGAAVLLIVARRYGAIIGAGFGLSVALAMWLWHAPGRGWRRAMSIAIVGGFVVAAVGATWFLSTERTLRRGSILTRLGLYEATAAAIRDRPVLGFGPDSYAARATTRLARSRSESPQVFHGQMAEAGHCEWLQATMELGVVGGGAYLLLPVLALAGAWRAFGASRDLVERGRIAGVFAGLAALVAAEASSVVLRSPMGPAWYWTMVGLVVCAGRKAAAPRATSASAVWGIGNAGLGVAIVAFGWIGLRASYEHALGLATLGRDPAAASRHLEAGLRRMDALEWLRARRALAMTRSVMLSEEQQRGGAGVQELARSAEAAWRELIRVCAGMPDSGPSLAEALDAQGDAAGAEREIRDWVERYAPFDHYGNLRMAKAEPDLSRRLEYVCRAIRNDRIDGEVERFLKTIRGEWDHLAAWTARVAAARADAGRAPTEWKDELCPEVMRLEAWRLAAAGQIAAARDMADGAAFATTSPGAEGGTRLARDPAAEADAFATYARLVYLANPRDYRRALEMIEIAEERAMNCVPHVVRSSDRADAEMIGDRIVISEYPAGTESMWSMSALLHLAAGNTRNLTVRIMGSLPAERRNMAEVERELGGLAFVLLSDFSRVPPSERPANFDSYVEIVRRNRPELLRVTKRRGE